MFNSFLNFFLDLVYPKNCFGCKKPGLYICPECFNQASPPDDQNLPSWIKASKSYRDPIIRKAIWFLKYQRKFDVTNELAAYIYDELLEELDDLKNFYNFTNPIIIPIPIHKETLLKRGFNQAEKLVTALGQIDQNKNFQILPNVLKKIKNTPQQATLKNRRQRLLNLKGSFALSDKELVKDRNIILLDDVATTGATLLEAKKVLEKAGAQKVVALTLAH